VSALRVVSALEARLPGTNIRLLGPPAAVVELHRPVTRAVAALRAAAISVLLFIGAALAIINFHTDVSMPQVQRSIYRLIVGHAVERPLALQIPYSLGVGLGVLLFFRGLGRNPGEAGPLELEADVYRRKLDDYYRHS
jgi:stage V sporulation protein AA